MALRFTQAFIIVFGIDDGHRHHPPSFSRRRLHSVSSPPPTARRRCSSLSPSSCACLAAPRLRHPPNMSGAASAILAAAPAPPHRVSHRSAAFGRFTVSATPPPLEKLQLTHPSAFITGVQQWQQPSRALRYAVVTAASKLSCSGSSPYGGRLQIKAYGQTNENSKVTKDYHPQNADLPRFYSKKEKKPFPIPVIELRRAARERLKKARGQPRRPVPPPKNGMLVRSLIPVAYEVMNARTSLINNLKRLMKAVPVKACKHCNEIHVGPIGHPFKSCRGHRADHRKGLHEWTSAAVEDIIVPVEAYHLFDRLGRRLSHDERYSTPRVPAIMELCIQAGVDLPDLPTKRRRKPVIRVGKNEIIDANEDDLPDPKPDRFKKPIQEEIPDNEVIPPADAEEIVALSESTLEAWETMRKGSARLMRKYAVRVCGYCPEVHVGASGHKAQICGAYKHQQRNGQHGWQQAVLDDLIPPRYVWHVPATETELKCELRNFYGQAPAVVELCAQGGAEVPEQYKATMRLDVGIPSNLREAEMVV